MSAPRVASCRYCGRAAPCRARADIRLKALSATYAWRARLCDGCAEKFARSLQRYITRLMKKSQPEVERHDDDGGRA